MTVGNNITIID